MTKTPPNHTITDAVDASLSDSQVRIGNVFFYSDEQFTRELHKRGYVILAKDTLKKGVEDLERAANMIEEELAKKANEQGKNEQGNGRPDKSGENAP